LKGALHHSGAPILVRLDPVPGVGPFLLLHMALHHYLTAE
jgi:hypothetical protein